MSNTTQISRSTNEPPPYRPSSPVPPPYSCIEAPPPPYHSVRANDIPLVRLSSRNDTPLVRLPGRMPPLEVKYRVQPELRYVSDSSVASAASSISRRTAMDTERQSISIEHERRYRILRRAKIAILIATFAGLFVVAGIVLIYWTAKKFTKILNAQ